MRYTLSILYLKRGAAHLAVRSLQELFKTDPSNLDVLLLLGKALTQLGFRNRALKALNSVLAASRTRQELDRAKEAAQVILSLEPRNLLATETLDLILDTSKSKNRRFTKSF